MKTVYSNIYSIYGAHNKWNFTDLVRTDAHEREKFRPLFTLFTFLRRSVCDVRAAINPTIL